MRLKLLLSCLLLTFYVTPNTGELSACYRDYTKRGCYPGMKNILPNMLDNKRDAIDWQDFEGFIHKLACHCAGLAKKHGYKLFGIRYYGECWAGNDVMLFEKFAYREKIPSRHCISRNYQKCVHEDSRECVGTENGEYIFEIVQRDSQVVNGGFSEWSEWSPCSASCGKGMASRERLCNNPEPYGTEAKDCEVLGDYTETKKCFQRCLINGGYSEWTSWSACSATCGKGVRTKSRECNNPRPQNGGHDCTYVGSPDLSESCNAKPCTALPCHFVQGDGTGGSEINIGGKNSITECINACVHLRHTSDKTINGVTIPSNTPTNGKVTSCYCEKLMTGPNSSLSWKTCKMDLSKEKVDGVLTQWTAWTACSKSCGGGERTRERSCKHPRNGGKECEGPFTESQECNKGKCSDIPCMFVKGDGTGGSEKNMGKKSSVDECLKTCAKKHLKDKTFSGVTIPFNTKMDGQVASCYCEQNWQKANSNGAWKTCKMDLSRLKVDGGFTPWTTWTACSKSCGGGERTRERSCTDPAPRNGGKECNGPTKDEDKCNAWKCPDIPCMFVKGDGTGGSEKNMGKMRSVDECLKTCAKKHLKDKTFSGVTIPFNTKMDGQVASCYCEQNWQKTNSNGAWKTCKMDLSRLKVDGVFTPWTTWSSCSTTCGGGERTRERSCTDPAPRNGGKECDGPTKDEDKCNAWKCPDIPCMFVKGDGSGGSEENVGKMRSVDECLKTCAKKHLKDKTFSGVTIPFNTKMDGQVASCYCERNWQKANSNGAWKTCKMDLSRLKVDGAFTPWTTWTSCSKSCGGGERTRERSCTNPAPENGGKECEGPTTQPKKCNEDNCPVNGGYSDWSSWNECSASCGGGLRKKIRECDNPKPTDGGQDCSHLGSNAIYGQCGKHACPIDGGFTPWTTWTSCSKSCGGGEKTRERSCTNPAPENGGKECEGPTKQAEKCNTEKCSDYRCNFAPGDGVGGSEKFIGFFKTRSECINACILRKKTEPTINGVTLDSKVGQHMCHCEYGMRIRNSVHYWQSCFLEH